MTETQPWHRRDALREMGHDVAEILKGVLTFAVCSLVVVAATYVMVWLPDPVAWGVFITVMVVAMVTAWYKDRLWRVKQPKYRRPGT